MQKRTTRGRGESAAGGKIQVRFRKPCRGESGSRKYPTFGYAYGLSVHC